MLRILLIDDDPLLIRDMVTMFGYEVDVAEDGYAGIQKFLNPEVRYDMVILDVRMPKMDGWATLKHIRTGDHRPNIPIIMLTCADEEKSKIAGLRRGADEYLIKPVTPGVLLAHIEAMARRSLWESQAANQMQDPEEQRLAQAFKMLTPREQELLGYIAQGHSNAKIGGILSISETTVKNHLASIFRKLDVTNRTQAAYVAQKLKLV